MAAPQSAYSLAPVVASHFRTLVQNLTKKNVKTTLADVRQLVRQHGPDAHLAFLRALVRSAEASQQSELRWQVLAQELASSEASSDFVSLVCRTFAGLDSLHQLGVNYLVSDLLHLPAPNSLAFLAALSQSSEPHVARDALAVLNVRLGPQVCHVSHLSPLPEEILHLLLFLVESREELQEVRPTFRALLRDGSLVTPVMAPIADLPPTRAGKWQTLSEGAGTEGFGRSLASLMQDVGYAATDSAGSLNEILSRHRGALSARDIAIIIGMMARTHSGLHEQSGGSSGLVTHFPPGSRRATSSTTWNLGVFCDVMQQHYAGMDWDAVFACLDHPGFVLPDPSAFSLVASVYRRCKTPRDPNRPLPLAPLLAVWENTAGQLSLLRLAVSAPVGTFDWGRDSPMQVDLTGSPLANAPLRPELVPWRSLSLIEALLRLSEVESYSIVRTLMERPLKQCPELLLLGLSQAQVSVGPAWEQQQRVPASAWSILAAELFRALIPRVVFPEGSPQWISQRLWSRARVHLVRAFAEALPPPSQLTENPEPFIVSRMFAIIDDDLEPLQRQQQQPTLAALLLLSSCIAQLGVTGVPLIVEIIVSAVARNLAWATDAHRWLRDIFMASPGGSNQQRPDDQRQLLLHQAASAARATLRYIDAKVASRGPDAALELQHLAPVFVALHTAAASNEAPLPGVVVDGVKRLMPRFQAAMQQRQLESQAPQQQPGGARPPPNVATGMTPAMVKLNQALSTTHGADGTPVADPNNANQRFFSPEVEAEGNAHFQSIYSGEQTIDAVLQMLQRYKVSTLEREQEIFACMIHSLFDEYRFFPNYPDRELHLTAVFFGSLVQKSLVSYLPLGLVLRCILNALRNPPPSKMLAFGITALQQFLPRLAEWPQYCSHVLAIPHLKQFPKIVEFIESVHGHPSADRPQQNSNVSFPSDMQDEGAGRDSSNSMSAPPGMAGPPGLGGATAPSQPVAQPAASKVLVKPTIIEEDSDKVHFIFNNVSENNLRVKGTELLAVLKDRDTHLQYVAYYLVTKRVRSESNFQKLYVRFLEETFSGAMSRDKRFDLLRRYIVEHTLASVRDLLNSEAVRTQASERSLLKNLGTWLGLWTVGRDKPLLHRHLAPRNMLVDAFRDGRLIVVVPFVCKVLETVASSKTFMPPNPWTMSLLRVLRDIYNTPRLRLNLKFEVEVLCKALGVQMSTLTTTGLLANVVPSEDSPDFTPAPKSQAASATAAQPTAGPQRGAAEAFATPLSAGPISNALVPPGVQRAGTPAVPQQPQRPSGVKAEVEVVVPVIEISPQIPLFAKLPLLKKQVPAAFERAIREIIGPVVERSVTIACITTKELLLKDFATEPDVNQLRSAAHVMVQNLAGSLALVTCKEPLRVSVTNHLRSILSKQVPDELQPMLEPAVQAIATDNLDVACSFIENAATEKAIRETDEALAPAILQRERFLEVHPERASMPRPTENDPPPTADQQKSMFCDPAVFTSRGGRWLAAMTPELRPHLGGLLPSQLAVYEDFARLPLLQGEQMQSGASGSGAILPGDIARDKVPASGAGGAAPASGAPMAPAPALRALTLLPAVGQFAQLLSQLATESSALRTTLAQLPPDHNVPILVQRAGLLVRQSAPSSREDRPAPSAFPAFPLVSTAAMARLALARLCDTVHVQQADAMALTALLRDSLLATLESVIGVHQQHLSQELTSWLLFLENQQYTRHTLGLSTITSSSQPVPRSRLVYHRALVPVLLRRGVISASAFDAFVAGQIAVSPAAADFATFVLQELVLKSGANVLSATAHLPLTAASLRQWAVYRRNDEIVQNVDAAIAVSREQNPEPRPQPDNSSAFAVAPTDVEDTRMATYRVFDGWVNAFDDWKMCLEACNAMGLSPSATAAATSDPNSRASRLLAATAAAEQRTRDVLQDVLQNEGIANEDVANRFFRLCCELSIERYLSSRAALSAQQAMTQRALAAPVISTDRRELHEDAMRSQQDASYRSIDAFSALVSLACKQQVTPQGRISLFSRILSTIVRLLITDYDSCGPRFQQRPYFRILSNWLSELFGDYNGSYRPLDPDTLVPKGKKKKFTKQQQRLLGKNRDQLKEIETSLYMSHSMGTDPYTQSQLLVAFSTALVALCPVRLPGFAFAWLELVSHRGFVPRVLMGVPGLTAEVVDRLSSGKADDNKSSVLPLAERGWPLFQRLLVELFRFLTPTVTSTEAGHVFYNGTIRTMLMLLHDFPDFLSDYHFSLCDAIPPMCVQLRNLVLSAVPAGLSLPDAATSSIDDSPLLKSAPRVLSPVSAALANVETPSKMTLKDELEAFLGKRGNPNFKVTLASLLVLPSQGGASRTNVPLLNAVVLFVGMHVLERTKDVQEALKLPLMLFEQLAADLDGSGRYFLIHAIVNHLRFPNSHSKFFSTLLVALFARASNEGVVSLKEQITRVLVERLVSHRPHPWGLLVTFKELISNSRYAFFQQPYVAASPEIERLLNSIGRLFMTSTSSATAPIGSSRPSQAPGTPWGQNSS